ncbi:patatin-like phospholipase family protein [Pikeienuella piscinae]|uniref:Patatin-like phospholipase family protein n=1 Tax=Pikeienuella piscinae TaxID=2748098 RepID=A0A7L5BZY5_9RHOB|nr:patatin-like phospholipase family protein [Pikeienuella piscinae]QIE56398.1 patatin-like phospholipase family protein [Pikeienuella piscinae]
MAAESAKTPASGARRRRAAPKAGGGSSPHRKAKHQKSINLALQGGGSHGAFTWGVLDKLFEDDRVWIEAISGTSAGAMNAVVTAQGLYENGPAGARRRLDEFWRAVSKAGQSSPIQRSIWAQMTGDWSLETSPGYRFFNALSGLVSPYDFNPGNINPLRDLVGAMVDFDKVRASGEMAVYIAATTVETGRVRIFEGEEITLDSVMASACLPQLFKAVEIDGKHYWDGGFMGNPPLYPFFYDSPARDIVIVQINPVVREGEPRTAAEITNRMNEITFNSALLHELRSIDFVARLLEDGKLDPAQYRKMNVHIIHSRKRMRPLDASSKMNSEWAFLKHLFEIGRYAATNWLRRYYDDVGERSSIDIREMFQGRPEPKGD